MNTEYAIYKGDTFVTLGTAKDIAEELGVSTSVVYYWASETAKKRCKGNSLLAYRIEVEA